MAEQRLDRDVSPELTLELQAATPELLPAIVDLDRRCFGKLWTSDQYQREMDSPNSDLWVLRPVGDPRTGDPRTGDFHTTEATPLVGYGCLWSIVDEAHITILAVHPDYRGHGLGQRLLWALLKSAVARGLTRSTLEVRVSNTAAIGLYKKFGFQEVGLRKKYYSDNQEDALILWKNKLQDPEFSAILATFERSWATPTTESEQWVNVTFNTFH
ncbi:ribosomal protein S18-alanine N-acetyltransferase [Alkalinema sp. FACHB-956]|uniref:ribosomal protein S18-alanine N-acetyltransferase n=1 Tax=Alkalinema sp. FACHB-956 TaxID=2692768 RepID=UPI0016899FB5|nr:ribosomal protein S18-alanine N-acetyltransferase [Alkalinema sp. FACHB-956]MBD2327560.1 ribosomal protein S18-alanine N-acetyltransferase [Alkalinema sp. FACHB-956]